MSREIQEQDAAATHEGTTHAARIASARQEIRSHANPALVAFLEDFRQRHLTPLAHATDHAASSYTRKSATTLAALKAIPVSKLPELKLTEEEAALMEIIYKTPKDALKRIDVAREMGKTPERIQHIKIKIETRWLRMQHDQTHQGR